MSSLAPIKFWKPKHENIVLLHFSGWSNQAIAEHVGISEVRVSQVIRDPRAQLIIKKAMDRYKENFEENISDRLLQLADTSVGRLQETLDKKFTEGSDPKKHQDNVALQLLKGKGFLSGDQPEKEEKEAKIPVSLLSRFTSALESANKVRQEQLTSGQGEEVPEADWEPLDEGADEETSEEGETEES